MDKLTLIYCTSNSEDPEFEGKIRQSLLESSKGLPIISVSQKPINFGMNICVGDIGASPINHVRQILVGLNNAESENVAIVSSDFLYPEEYFNINVKDKKTFYYPKKVFLLWVNNPIFFGKRIKEFMCISNRLHMLRVLKKIYKIKPDNFPQLLKKLTKQAWIKTQPLVTFKTRDGLHWRSPRYKSRTATELPNWGSAEELIKEYYGHKTEAETSN